MRIAFSSILGLILGLGLLGYAVFGGEPAVYWGFIQPAGLGIVLGEPLPPRWSPMRVGMSGRPLARC